MTLPINAHPFHLTQPTRRTTLGALSAALLWPSAGRAQAPSASRLQSWPLKTPRATGIHDVAPAPDGGVWFSAQRSGHLGWFDPRTGKSELIALGSGSSPHGVIAGPDGAAWLTDGGQNAIARVSWPAREVKLFPLPAGTPYANLNTCAFDGDGDLWFTGQGGYVGKVAVRTGLVSVKESPRGRGPYGICATPKGDVWWCSLAGSFIAQIDRKTGESRIVEPPTPRQGAPRLVRQPRPHLGVRMEQRQPLHARPGAGHGRQQLAHLESARSRAARIRCVRGRQRHRLGRRVEQQRHAALRPEEREVRRAHHAAYRHQHPPDTGPIWGGLAARERDGVYFGNQDSVNAAKIAQSMFGGPAASGWHTGQGCGPVSSSPPPFSPLRAGAMSSRSRAPRPSCQSRPRR
ncbi:hypothetical protein LP417_03070 [Polaromonas sp. P1-6]|nr:hypothetical protein LP417_03070 [Polaromonas sp. P1-6]